MGSAENVTRVFFAALASLLSASFGFGYNQIQYHNNVEHLGCALPQITQSAATTAPLMFLVPLAILVVGLACRKRPMVVLVTVNVGWLVAVTWPPLLLWAWAVPHTLL